jgi:hypothetical protein
VYGANVMTVQHVRKWCWEFDSGGVNVPDENRSGLSSTSADLVQDIDAADRLCGLVVSVEDYKHRCPGFDSRALLRIFLRDWSGTGSTQPRDRIN